MAFFHLLNKIVSFFKCTLLLVETLKALMILNKLHNTWHTLHYHGLRKKTLFWKRVL